MTREDAVRNFYRRLAAAFTEPSDKRALERQVGKAAITSLDDEHDQFAFAAGPDPADALSVDTLEAVYRDDDGHDVNVIVHFVGDHILWAERYRNLGDPIRCWPPADDAPLRLSLGGPPT